MRLFQRNVILLAVCQSLMMSGMSLMITTVALVGLELASDKSFSTLPMTALFIAMMLTSIPASFLMKRIGRKQGFMFSTFFGVVGALTATLAIIREEFWLFVTGTLLIGVFNGFGNYYRFAAMDAVDSKHKSQAVSFILTGGVIAALVGPNLASWTRDTIELAPFAGSYAALIILYMLSFIALSFIRLPPHIISTDSRECFKSRSLHEISKQPQFIVALICGMFGYGAMNLVMTATPLSMHHHAHPFTDTAFVIQWHALGMFARNGPQALDSLSNSISVLSSL